MSVYVDLYREQIERLVEDHKKVRRNGKLLFAGWYDRDNDMGDINLFEVYEDFPDPGLGKLETFPFPSSASFPIKGSLRLTVTSPSELREAAERNDQTLAAILASKDKQAIYPRNGDWDQLIRDLSL